MEKKNLALMLGITGDLAFAAGSLLLALKRHSPGWRPDILLYHDGTVPETDMNLLRELGARPLLFAIPEGDFDPQALKTFSPLALARFEAFLLLEIYRTVIWLDVDTAVQGDLSGLADYGPFSLALEDPSFTQSGQTSRAGINVSRPVPELDQERDNLNSGVMVLGDALPDPLGLYAWCMDKLRRHAPHLKYMDQPVLNMLAQKLERENPELFRLIPHDEYNAHPRNPLAWKAKLVHAFGSYKLWNDGLTLCSFPEWGRDYQRWLDLGGSAWRGGIENSEFLSGGAFNMLGRFYETQMAADKLLRKQAEELQAERKLREHLEIIVGRHELP